MIWRGLTWLEASVRGLLWQKPEFLAFSILGSMNLILRTHGNVRALKIWIILILPSHDLFLCLNGMETRSDGFRILKKTVPVHTLRGRMSV